VRFEVLREFDPWKGELCTCPRKYSLQPYTNCQFGCLYCYATSYIRQPFGPKKNFLERLKRDLKKADKSKVINMSTSSDPYPWIEEKLMLTRRAIELILRSGFKLLITTKSHLVSRDVDLLRTGNAAAMVTITTLDSDLAKKMEPAAPSPNLRLKALDALRESGVPFGVRIDPIVPGVNEDFEDVLKEVLERGASHITFSIYKAKPDNLRRMAAIFPHLKDLYKRGVKIGGYTYLPTEVRTKIIKKIIETADKYKSKYKFTYAFCREGVITDSPSCDGSHLVLRARPR